MSSHLKNWHLSISRLPLCAASFRRGLGLHPRVLCGDAGHAILAAAATSGHTLLPGRCFSGDFVLCSILG